MRHLFLSSSLRVCAQKLRSSLDRVVLTAMVLSQLPLAALNPVAVTVVHAAEPNIVLNPSFEQSVKQQNCVSQHKGLTNDFVQAWDKAYIGLGSGYEDPFHFADYYDEDCNITTSGVTIYSDASNGKNHHGGWMGGGYAEYIQAELSEPLVPGQKYSLSFDIKTPKFSNGVSHVGTNVYLGADFYTEKQNKFGNYQTPFVASANIVNIPRITLRKDYQRITVDFTAKNAGKYFIMGSFLGMGGGHAYVFTDNYSLTKKDAPPPPQCSDGKDNDGDYKIDYPNDPGCSSPEDNDEYNSHSSSSSSSKTSSSYSSSSSFSSCPNLSTVSKYGVTVVNNSPLEGGLNAVSDVLGPPDNAVAEFSNIGTQGGYVTIRFDNALKVINGPGNDLKVHLKDFWIPEDERFEFFVSQDGTTFVSLGIRNATQNVREQQTSESFDIASSGLPYVTTVRIVNVHGGQYEWEGVDIDAIEALNVLCPPNSSSSSSSSRSSSHYSTSSSSSSSSKSSSSSSSSSISSGTPKLEISKTGPATITQNGSVSYTITAKNSGNTLIKEAVVFDNFPSTLTYVVAGSSTACSLEIPGRVRCEIGDFPAGQSKSFILNFTLSAQAACNSTVSNNADIHARDGLNAWSDFTSTVICQSIPQCKDGLDNDGDYKTDYPNDPGCTGPDDNDETNPPPPQCSDGKDNDGDGKVDFGRDPGCDSVSDNDEYNDASGAPELHVKKNGPATVNKNGTISYTVFAENTGNKTSYDTVVVDNFPTDVLQFISGQSTPGCTLQPTFVHCIIGDFGPGETRSFTFTFKVKDTVSCNTIYQNKADIQGRGGISGWDMIQTTVVCAEVPQCNDYKDNDGDGKVDYPQDPGCTGPDDNDETNPPPPQCSDGKDNDGDYKVDYPNDPGCDNPQDNDETNTPPPLPQCKDGKDNDGDGKVDYPQDPGCTGPDDNDETNTPPSTGPKLEVEKKGPSTIGKNGIILYQILVKNSGDTTAQGTVVADHFPLNQLEYIPGQSTAGCTLQSTFVLCILGDFASQQSKNITLAFKVKDSVSCNENVTNKVDLQAAGGLSAWDDALTTVTCDPPPSSECTQPVTGLNAGSVYLLGDHPDGALLPPTYGFRLGSNTYSFETQNSEVKMTYNPNQSVHISGIVYGGLDSGGNWSNPQHWKLDMEFTNGFTTVNANQLIVKQASPENCGTLSPIDNPAVGGFSFCTIGNDENVHFAIEKNYRGFSGFSGFGWVQTKYPNKLTGTQDFLFTLKNLCPPAQQLPQCKDGKDNDGDGKVDYPSDSGCSNPEDNDETNPYVPQCSDGKDNDGDGKVDYPADPGCENSSDDNETNIPPTTGPDLRIDKKGPVTINPNGTITYEVLAQNFGDASAQGTVVADHFPTDQLEFIAAQSSSGCRLESGFILCEIGEFAPQQSKNFTFVFKLKPSCSCGSTIMNQADLQAAGGLSAWDKVQTSVQCN